MITQAPPLEWRAWTPSDDDQMTDQNGNPIVARGFMFASDGAIRLQYGSGRIETIPSGTLNAKTFYWVQIRRIYNTGTTATGIRVGIDARS